MDTELAVERRGLHKVSPADPFTLWPVQLFDERFGFAWYAEPCALVTQLIHPVGTVEAAHALQDAIDHVVSEKHQDIAEHNGLLLFHDWRRMTSYDPDARVAFRDRMRVRDAGHIRHVVAVLPDTRRVRMVEGTATIARAIGVRSKLQVATEPWQMLCRHRIANPVFGRWP